MDYYINDQQIEELVNFDYVCEDLEDLIAEEQDFSMNEYLKSNIDYWSNESSYLYCQRAASSSRTSWEVEAARFPIH